MEQHSGKLTLFLSYTPGAGKSHFMVSMASGRKQSGEDVTIGHLNGAHRDFSNILKCFPDMEYKGKKYSVSKLIQKKPDLVVLDELGLYGINLDKKSFVYEDATVLMENGIDVYSSANVKRFKSANPLFYNVTGIKIKKTIPDEFLKKADKIYFIDRDPEDMANDFKNGNLFSGRYLKSGIMEKNFRPDTLIAYRQIAIDYLKDYEDKLEIIKR